MTDSARFLIPHCSYSGLMIQGVTFEGDTWFGGKSQEQAIAVDTSSDSPPGLVFAAPPLKFWNSPGGPLETSHPVSDVESYNMTFLDDEPELVQVEYVRPR